MIARPIVPGRSYQVHGAGIDLTVLATNPVDAICIAIDMIKETQQ